MLHWVADWSSTQYTSSEQFTERDQPLTTPTFFYADLLPAEHRSPVSAITAHIVNPAGHRNGVSWAEVGEALTSL